MKSLDPQARGAAAGLSLRFSRATLDRIASVARRSDLTTSELCRSLVEGALDQVDTAAIPVGDLPKPLVRVRQRLSEAPQPVVAPTDVAPEVLAAIEARILAQVLAAVAKRP